MGNQPIEPRMDGDVKVFEMTIDEIEHRIDAFTPALAALGYNGTWPGPRITVVDGDKVRAVRCDVVIELDEPGAWAFHCHILPHAEGMDGMFGMVTTIVVQDAAAALQLQAAGAPAFACVIPTEA